MNTMKGFNKVPHNGGTLFGADEFLIGAIFGSEKGGLPSTGIGIFMGWQEDLTVLFFI